MKLVVGLGNPGDKFIGSRHNLGFEVVDKFIATRLPSTDYSQKFWKQEEKFKAVVGRLEAEDLLVVKPATYMNQSGLAVKAVINFFKIQPQDIIVIHDELDLLLGHIKIRLGGSGAGHHGIESIIKSLGTDQFIRVRLGIGGEKTLSGEHKQVAFNAEHFVMEPFLPKERSKIRAVIKRAVKAIKAVLTQGWQKAQNQYN